MQIDVKSGDVLDEPADALICSANVQLNMSGGVNGAILLRGGENVQQELRDYLASTGRHWVEPGTVVKTGPGPLAVRHILHAVSVNGMYDSSIDLVADTIIRALHMAADANASSAALPALATGYGRLTIADFARALAEAVPRADQRIKRLVVVMRSESDISIVTRALEAAA